MDLLLLFSFCFLITALLTSNDALDYVENILIDKNENNDSKG